VRSISVNWRRGAGLPDSATVFLFAGKLERKKCPDLLLRAFLQLRTELSHEFTQAALVFVGSGPLEAELRAIAGERVGRDVFFVPFQNQTAMPAAYAASDVLVLPSASTSETWGLVVNEAMAVGRPAIVSDCVGCGPDLVTPGETGWVVERGNELSLRAALAEAVSNPARLRRMGQSAARRVDLYSFDAATDGLERALDSVVPNERVRAPDAELSTGARR
jgi:glycosyltransferase involved in cell wall biosynthesis